MCQQSGTKEQEMRVGNKESNIPTERSCWEAHYKGNTWQMLFETISNHIQKENYFPLSLKNKSMIQNKHDENLFASQFCFVFLNNNIKNGLVPKLQKHKGVLVLN